MFYYENNMDKITQIIIEACFLDAPPNADDRLKEELGLDSLSLVTLLVRFENELEIEIEDDDLNPDKLLTVGALREMLSKYVV